MGRRAKNDPGYNPNLTLDHEDYGLSWPPRIKGTQPFRPLYEAEARVHQSNATQ